MRVKQELDESRMDPLPARFWAANRFMAAMNAGAFRVMA